MLFRFLARIGLAGCLVILGSAYGFAQVYPGGQTPGGSTSTTGSSGGGYGSSGAAIGIGVGAAVGATVAYLALRGRGSLKGCVEEGAEGVMLTDENTKKTYVLSGHSAAIKPGEHVELKGKKKKDDSGALTFQVSRLVRKNGPCSP